MIGPTFFLASCTTELLIPGIIVQGVLPVRCTIAAVRVECTGTQVLVRNTAIHTRYLVPGMAGVDADFEVTVM